MSAATSALTTVSLMGYSIDVPPVVFELLFWFFGVFVLTSVYRIFMLSFKE